MTHLRSRGSIPNHKFTAKTTLKSAPTKAIQADLSLQDLNLNIQTQQHTETLSSAYIKEIIPYFQGTLSKRHEEQQQAEQQNTVNKKHKREHA